MSPLRLTLRPVRLVGTSHEAAEFSLILGNPSDHDLPIPRAWYAGARVEATCPDGRMIELFPFGEAPPDSAQDDEILGDSDRAQRFVLRDSLPSGLYRLRAALALDVALQAEATWFLEAPAPAHLVISRDADGNPVTAWSLLPGTRQATLLRSALSFCDVSAAEPAYLSWPGRVAVAEPTCRGLVAGVEPAQGGSPSERVAWLCGERGLTFGTTTVLFDCTSVELPGPARRILTPLLCRGDGSCDVLALAADGSAVWAYRAAPPVAHPPPPTPAFPFDVEPPADQTGEEEFFVPGADVSAPVLLATIALPFAPTHVAAAAGSGTTWIVCATNQGTDIELAAVVVDDRLRVRGLTRARVAQARLLDHCDPWITLAGGYARVAVLFGETDTTQPAVGLAYFAFDPSPLLVWIKGIGRRRVVTLGAAPIAGVLTYERRDAWPSAWGVRTADGRVVAGRTDGGAEPRACVPTGDPLAPMVLLVSEDALVLAVDASDGQLGFVRI